MDVLLLFKLLPSLLAKLGAAVVVTELLARTINYKMTLLNKPKDKIKDTRKAVEGFINDKSIINAVSNIKADVKEITNFRWGCRIELDIAGVVGYKDLENELDYLKQLFRAKEVTLENREGKAIIDVINNPAAELEYKPMELPPTQLLLGYNMKGEPIIIDMRRTPHIGVQGASNSGKSKGIELALKNASNIDIVLLNTFDDDFTSLDTNVPIRRVRRINGNEEILKYLESIIENPVKRERPLYIVLDELNVIGKDKAINKAIQDVLSQARHYNIYFIALGQSLLKENCPYKQLFNVRVTFRAIDRSTIGAFLGCTVEDTNLLQQEFICYSDNIYRGKTYNYDF